MDLSRTTRRVLLIATLWVPAYGALFMCLTLVATAATSLRAPGGGDPAWVYAMYRVLFPITVLTAVEGLAVTAAYVYLILSRYVGDEAARVRWLLAVVLGGSVGQIAFFVCSLRPRRSRTGVGAGAG